MARLACDIKGGYYAAHPNAVAHVLSVVRPPGEGECFAFDPCAGEGKALLQIAELLGATPYAVELADDRSSAIEGQIPPEQFLPSTDFLRTRITHGSFSLVWCNPPFTDAKVGNRTERVFTDAALPLLVDGGLLIMVCPESVADNYQTIQWFNENCYDVSVVEFPEGFRPYNEVAVMGLKRKKRNDDVGWVQYSSLLNRNITYHLPAGKRPPTFIKSEPTDAEVEALLAKSTLNSFLHPVGVQRKLPRPPLSVSTGHIAMLLATGEINGLLEPPDEPPHVVRGYINKEKHLKSSDCEEDAQGVVTTKTVWGERIVLTIRTLDSEGVLQTLSTAKEEEDTEDE